MKKHLLSILITAFLISILTANPSFAQTSQGFIPNRGCGTMEHKAKEEKANPSVRETRKKIEQEAKLYIENQAKSPGNKKAGAVITIPVVFHVIYNTSTPTENVSDACIQAQLKVINDDFRKLNADWSNVTQTGWNALVADCEIEFCLAVRDPNGNPTNGITRTVTTAADFDDSDSMKYTAQGGHDVWDRDQYFNIWVCDLSGGLLGYAQFPGGDAATDGLVIDYQFMIGAQGCGTAPYDKGRTSTHELGHCFGLYHIWGDDGADCSGTDDVADTPNQSEEHYGCFAAGSVQTDSCSPSAPGTMWMNYMDYTDDACMYMFTVGQKAVIDATMNGPRQSLKTSTACSPITGVEYLLVSESVSVYPNPASGNVTVKLNIPDLTSPSFTVYNTIGETVFSKHLDRVSNSKEIKLDMTTIPDGIYFLKIQTQNGSITKKIVMNK